MAENEEKSGLLPLGAGNGILNQLHCADFKSPMAQVFSKSKFNNKYASVLICNSKLEYKRKNIPLFLRTV